MMLKYAFAVGLTVVASQAGAATLTPSGSVGGAPTGTNLINFDDLALGTVTNATATGPSGSVTVTTTPNAAVVQGASSGVYAAPFLSGGNGTGFGSPNQPNGADTTPYLTSGSTGSLANAEVTLTFATKQLYFGLLWGSVDLYNTLSFYDGNTLLGSITGGQVLAGANGNQGVNGTLYVNIISDTLFNKVVATSSQFAFEFDNVAYLDRNPANPVPLPAAAWLFASALAGTGLLARRRRKQVSAPVA